MSPTGRLRCRHGRLVTLSKNVIEVLVVEKRDPAAAGAPPPDFGKSCPCPCPNAFVNVSVKIPNREREKTRNKL